MGGKSKAPAPDPNIGIAQQQMAEIARQQLQFTREQFYAEQPRLDRYADLADQFVRTQSQLADQQKQLTADYQQRMQGTFYPIEDTLAFDALGYYDASPEQQAKIEQAYLEKNKQLVNQRFDDAAYQAQQDEIARRQSFEKQAAELGGLATKGVEATQTRAPGLRGKMGEMRTQYTPQEVATVGSSINQRIQEQSKQVASLENEMAKYKPESTEYRQLAARLGDANDNLAKLEGFRSSFADYTTVDKDSGLTLAEKAAKERAAGLQTQRDRALGDVGSNLDSVRAYAETYKSGQEQQAGMARQDVAQQFDARGLQLARQAQAMGVDPTSARFLATQNSNALMQAASEAQAMNQARQAAKQLGWAKRMDAAGLGRGLPGSQATSASLTQSLGQGGLAGQAGISGMYQNANNAFMSGLGQASQGFSALGNLSMQKYAQQSANVNASNAAKAEMTGALVGAGAGLAGAFA